MVMENCQPTLTSPSQRANPVSSVDKDIHVSTLGRGWILWKVPSKAMKHSCDSILFRYRVVRMMLQVSDRRVVSTAMQVLNKVEDNLGA